MSFWGFIGLIFIILVLFSARRQVKDNQDAVDIIVYEEQQRRMKERANNQAMTEKQILTVTQTVLVAFSQAAEKRNETIPETVLLNIAGKMVIICQIHGPEFLTKHLRYELDRYPAFPNFITMVEQFLFLIFL